MLLVDGHDLTRFCRGVTMHAPVDGINIVTLDLIARAGLDFDVPAKTTVNITAMPGFHLVQRVEGDRVIYTSEREETP